MIMLLDPDMCTQCGICAEICPMGIIFAMHRTCYIPITWLCLYRCGNCELSVLNVCIMEPYLNYFRHNMGSTHNTSILSITSNFMYRLRGFHVKSKDPESSG